MTRLMRTINRPIDPHTLDRWLGNGLGIVAIFLIGLWIVAHA